MVIYLLIIFRIIVLIIVSYFDFEFIMKERGVAPSLEGNTPLNPLCLTYSLYVVG
jgi:hypothetical protein